MNYGFTLAVDGSTYAGSVAVISDRTVLAARELPGIETPGRSGREEGFLPMVAACLDESGVDASQLARVVCGAGPGSFTSLRIAGAIAKGMAAGTGRPLFAVSSLVLLECDAVAVCRRSAISDAAMLTPSTSFRRKTRMSLLSARRDPMEKQDDPARR